MLFHFFSAVRLTVFGRDTVSPKVRTISNLSVISKLLQKVVPKQGYSSSGQLHSTDQQTVGVSTLSLNEDPSKMDSVGSNHSDRVRSFGCVVFFGSLHLTRT